MDKESGFFHALYEALGSLKLTVSVFLVLAVSSIVGTLFPQGLTPEEVEHQFRPGVAWVVNTFGLADLYRTGWFRTLLVLLCANLVVCSLQRFPKTLKLLKHREERVDPAKLSKFAMSREIPLRFIWQQADPILTEVLSERFRSIDKLPETEAFTAIAEKGRSSALMVYVVHLSVLVILLGALLGSTFGFKGFMNLSEGESSAEVILYQGNQVETLPFEVRCDKFSVSFYENGMPREYRSDLAVVEKGKDVYHQSILVNDPMTYDGITFYQASYGTALKQAEVQLTDRDSGRSYTLTLPFREPVDVPGTRDKVQIFDYRADMGKMGPVLALVLFREGIEPVGARILVDKPDFHGNRVENYQVKVLSAEQSKYTGLQVKRDPGVWVVWLGFVTMLVGIGMTFCMSHRKIWVWCGPSSVGANRGKIVIAGRSSKNPLAFEREFNELCERIEERLNSAQTGK